MADVQDLREIEMPKDQEHSEEKGDEQGERQFVSKQLFNRYSCDNSTAGVRSSVCFFPGEATSQGQEERPASPSHLATTVF